jgi:hypothetical protein
MPKHAFCRSGKHAMIGHNAMPLKSGRRRCRQCFYDTLKQHRALRALKKYDASVLAGEIDFETMDLNRLATEHARLTGIVSEWEKVCVTSREQADKVERNLTRKIGTARARADRDFKNYKRFVLKQEKARATYDRRCKALPEDEQPF